jgi:membrane-bound ClpP family serine protease
MTALLAVGSDTYLVVSIGLLLLALVLLALEIFIPTGGLLGVLCGTAFVASVVSMFLYSVTAGLLLVMGSAISSPFLVLGLARVWVRSPIARRLAVGDDGPTRVFDGAGEDLPEHDRGDPDAVEAAQAAARRSRQTALDALVGREATADTDLRPAGFIRLEGRRLDAVAESSLIEAGTRVRIISAAEGLLRVRAGLPANLPPRSEGNPP